MKVYIDESGHSGRDLYNPSQPILTYAGIWLDPATEQHIAETLAVLRTRYKRHQRQITGELKGARLLKTSGGRAMLRDLFQEMVNSEVTITLIAVEKLFMAAGVVVEDCTDYVYNPQFDKRWTWDTQLKGRLVKLILQASDQQLLMDVWRLRTQGDKTAWMVAYERLLFSLSLHTNTALANAAQRMRSVDFDELWDSLESVRREGIEYSPNFSAFNAMLQSIEQQAEAMDLASVELVHDEQKQYRQVFTRWWSMLHQAHEGRLLFPNGNELRTCLRRLAGLTFGDSAQTGLQIADFIASAARVVLQNLGDTVRSMEAYTGELAALLRAPSTAFVIGSEEWQPEALGTLLQVRLSVRGD